MKDVTTWGIEALHRASAGLKCTTAVHICYGYGIKANIDWKETLGGEWRQYGEIFPALAASRLSEVSVECIHSKVPLNLLALLKRKNVQVGVIDVASDAIETPEEICSTIEAVLKHVPSERVVLGTNCGMAPMRRDIASAKLDALGKGAALARKRFG
jgi:5-methyltetrahydropteroyltriglutamate--homocysteine methyltransferase